MSNGGRMLEMWGLSVAVVAALATPGRAEDATDAVVRGVITVDGTAAAGEAQITFLADGSVAGSTGCNRFRGRAAQPEDRLLLDGPLAGTRMACDSALMQQEDAILSILAAGPRVGYSLLRDEVTLSAEDGRTLVLGPRGPAVQ